MVDKSVVVIHNNEPRIGTFLVADGFKREHKRITFFVKKYRERFETYGHISTHKVKTKGRSIEEYLLNEGQATFLISLLKNTEEVLDFKQRLVHDFIDCKNKLRALEEHRQQPEYKITRDAGKIVRKKVTDTMQLFVEYAESQSSTNASFYYANITRMVNGLLFIVDGKFKDLRSLMTTQQLMVVSAAEQAVNKGLLEGMENQVYYKDIYVDVKSRIMVFASLTGQSEVIEKQLLIDNETT